MNLSEDTVELHASMLSDRDRTTAFIEAIKAAVRPGDVVLDIGTGTGVLAIAAAQAGARHVYAIEAGAISRLATKIIRRNDLDDRITVIRKWSTDAELPEKANVLVSELIGHEPLAEGVLSTISDARRMLTRNARIIPAALEIRCVPCSLPPSVHRKILFSDAGTSLWQSWYGIDFSPLNTVNRNRMSRHLISPYALRSWARLGDEHQVHAIDFRTSRNANIERVIDVPIVRGRHCNAFVFSFKLHLDNSRMITNSPDGAHRDGHWKCPVWISSEGFDVRPGDVMRVRYSYEIDTEDCSIDVEHVVA